MEENSVEENKMEENTKISLKDATIDQLKAGAFDIDQQIRGLQQQYQIILAELQSRTESKQSIG